LAPGSCRNAAVNPAAFKLHNSALRTMNVAAASDRPSCKKRSGTAVLSLSTGVVLVAVTLARSVPWFFASFITDVHSNEFPRRLTNNGNDSGTESVGVWMGLVAMAMFMKLAASIDDVAWLLPFVSGSHKRRNGLFYILCMQIVVLIAFSISTGGEKLLSLVVPDDAHWPLARILELISAILLTIYSVKLFRDWWLERHEDNEDDDKDTKNDISQTEVQKGGSDVAEEHQVQSGEPEPVPQFPKEKPVCVGKEQPPTDDIAESASTEPATAVGATEGTEASSSEERDVAKEHTHKDQQHSLGKLFTISMFGSLDDCAVFVSLMLAGVISGGQLAAGVFIGSIIVLAICVGASLFSCVVRTVEKIPLWSIIGTFAIWTYISTFAMH